MINQPIPVRIPLLGISGKVGPETQAGKLPQGLNRVSELEVPVSRSLPEACYAMEIPDIIGESSGSLGIFEPGKEVVALNDVYALGISGQEPLIRKVIKNDARPDPSSQGGSSQNDSSNRTKSRRKSFMTPTPLHIPESKVSPIPDSAHEMVYLKGLSDDEALRVVPLRDIVWMHPLIEVVENPLK